MGLLFILMVLEYPFHASLAAFLFVRFTMDPIYVVISLWKLDGFSTSRLLYVIRHVDLHICIQIFLGHCRFCALLTIGMAVSLFRVILKQRKTKVLIISHLEGQIRSYKSLNVMLTLLLYTVNPMIGHILGVSYVLAVTGFCAVVYFAKIDKLFFSFGFLFFTILVFVQIILVFGLGAYLLGTTGQTIRKFEGVSSKWKSHRARVCQAHIKSLRPLHLKTGNFSMMVSIDLMKGYLSALLESCINTSLLMDSLLNV